MIDTQVAIVGAGLAGLNAARPLHRAGIDFMLFEARDRPGGRILTAGEDGQRAASISARRGSGRKCSRPSAISSPSSAFRPLASTARAMSCSSACRARPRIAFPACGRNRSRCGWPAARGADPRPHARPAAGQSPHSLRFEARVAGMRLIGDGVELSVRHTDGRRETARPHLRAASHAASRDALQGLGRRSAHRDDL